MKNKTILLISFYNQKSLGTRYLEKALESAGYVVYIVFFKGFNSTNPKPASSIEIELLKEIIEKVNPTLIGLSVMTSLYLETVYNVNSMLKQHFDIPVAWGGVYATLFPEKCLHHADYVIRGEGEYAVIELANALTYNTSTKDILNLAHKEENSININDVRPLLTDLDVFGYPNIGKDNKYFINNNKLFKGDPLLNSVSFELIASRGCPFVCSYCCSVNLRRVYKDKGTFVRFRSVESVISELKEAKQKMKNLKVIHFWDEIFSDDENWINKFIDLYKKEINLPFEIWGHPLKINKSLIQKLVGIGLYKVVMGIQSGSPRVRKQVFHRVETQEQVVNATKILSECGVPQVIYDFILNNPFDTEEDIKETYNLCKKLYLPFELQLHKLNFFPGTDLVGLVIKNNIYTEEELENIMYCPQEEQYSSYWNDNNSNPIFDFWYALIYMTQFKFTRPLAQYFVKNYDIKSYRNFAVKIHTWLKKLSKIRYFYNKGRIVLRAYKGRGELKLYRLGSIRS